MAFQPDDESCAQLVNMLTVLRVPGTQQYTEAQAALEQFEKNPEFVLYLAYILAECGVKGVREDVRQLAGLLLKKIIAEKTFGSMNDLTQLYIKNQLLKSVQDSQSHPIRSTAGTCITTIVSDIKLETWQELLPCLASYLDAADPNQIDGSFNTLLKICEDSAFKLDSEKLGHPLGVLIPKFISFFGSPHESFRLYAVKCLNNLILLLPAALVANMEPYLQGLSALAQDPCAGVRKGVCQAIVMLLDVHVEALMPHMPALIEFMLRATEDADHEVAIEAAEFWPSYCESHYPIHETLLPYLPRILPVLLKNLVFSEYEINGFDDALQDESVPDRPEDIRPMFHKSKARGGGDDDDDDDEVSEWTLRKSCATGIDIICTTYRPSQTLQVILPELQQRFSSHDVWVRESAILALGALAHGCIKEIAEHLPQLFPFLLAQLNDSVPQVRSITCWALSRYTTWAAFQENQSQYLQPLMQGLLQRVLDRHKKVQEAACSAFSNVEQEVGPVLEPFLPGIAQNLVLAMNKYQARSLIILFDTIGTLADSVGQALNKPEVLHILMPPLLSKWESFGEQDKQLFPYLECLTSVAQAIGPGFQDYAKLSYDRCLVYIEKTLLAYATCEHTGIDPPEKEYIVCPLDLLIGMVDGLKNSFEVLAANTNLLPLLYECVKDRSADVRQSALGLVGEMAKNCMNVLAPALSKLLPEMIKNLIPENPPLCNNASWSIGETAVKVGKDAMSPYSSDIVNILVRLVNDDRISRHLLENCSITLGRFGLICPEVVAPLLEHFFTRWCMGMGLVQSRDEKISASTGLCLVIQANSAAFGAVFVPFCHHVVGSWHSPLHSPMPEEIRLLFQQLLLGYKGSVGDSGWHAQWSRLPADLQQYICEALQVNF